MVLSQHALQQRVPARGGSAPNGGCLLQGGSALGGGVSAPEGVCGDPPQIRRLLLRTVRILLECILVPNTFTHLTVSVLSSAKARNYFAGCSTG